MFGFGMAPVKRFTPPLPHLLLLLLGGRIALWALGYALPDSMHALDGLWSFLFMFMATPALVCEWVGLGCAWRELFRANAITAKCAGGDGGGGGLWPS